ncbi:MAG TPA: hypothetical protein VFU42_07165 [Candidatus Deferrimicrobiaceae bacterium]|nr:hypothetical protein [Candidatus Deferrimicrobiaceae bacterium]
MELKLTGMEIHTLRETLEGVLSGIDKDLARAKESATGETIKRRREVLRVILGKLPAEMTEVA